MAVVLGHEEVSAHAALASVERVEPLARLALRFRFSYLIAAARS